MDTPEEPTVLQKEEKRLDNSTSSNSQEKEKDLDYIFETIVGSTGWGQWSILLAQFFIRASGSMALFISIFTTFEPLHLCLVSNCESEINSDITFHPLNVSKNLKYIIENRFNQFDSCKSYNVIDSSICLEKPLKSYASNCKHFIYDKTDLVETWTTKYSLVCNMSHWQTYLDVSTMLGIMTGLIFGGRLCDSYGRKKTMIICMVILCPTFLFGGISPNYAFWPYYCVLCILSATATAMWICGDILTLEIFGTTQRGSVMAYNLLIDQLAKLLIVAIAYLTKDWKYIHLVGGLFCAISSSGFFFIPESVRWLVIKNRVMEGEKVLLEIGRRNGKVISNDMKTEMRKILKSLVSRQDVNRNKTCIFYLFDFSHLSSTMALMISWMSICVAQSILINQETFIKTKNVFHHSLLSILIKDLPQPIFLFIIVKLCGRRVGLFAGQLVVGICCTILSFIGSNGNQISISIVTILGICFSKGMLALVGLITIEIHATSLRGHALGFFLFLGKLVSILIEITTPLNHSSLVICTLPVILAAFMAYFIAETRSFRLPLSMDDADKLNGIKRKHKTSSSQIKETENEMVFRSPQNLSDAFMNYNESVPFYALPECEFNELKMHAMV